MDDVMANPPDSPEEKKTKALISQTLRPEKERIKHRRNLAARTILTDRKRERRRTSKATRKRNRGNR
jgi:hypothetical protein